MRKRKILVIGSVAIDNTIYTHQIPVAGMTSFADSYISNIGGKGANQACASLFLGGDVTFIGAVGKDNNGDQAINLFNSLELKHRVKRSNEPTGTAFIIIDENNAENRILIVQGANNDLNKQEIDANLDLFCENDILLIQFENPSETVEYAIKTAKEKKMLVVVNPAPVKKINDSTYQYIDYLVPNEHEVLKLTNSNDVISGAKILLEKGAKNIIVTLGEKGSILINNKEQISIAPYKVNAVDTTAAGDSYLGALVTKLAENCDIKEAMAFASRCSSLTVTKKGAIISLPHLADLIDC